MITIQVFNVTDGDAVINGTSPRKLLRACGFLPGPDGEPGQLFIESRIMEGHEPSVQSAAVKEITAWLGRHRPTWDICIDGPYVRNV